jgi:hypothetical protein
MNHVIFVTARFITDEVSDVHCKGFLDLGTQLLSIRDSLRLWSGGSEDGVSVIWELDIYYVI